MILQPSLVTIWGALHTKQRIVSNPGFIWSVEGERGATTARALGGRTSPALDLDSSNGSSARSTMRTEHWGRKPKRLTPISGGLLIVWYNIPIGGI